MKGWVVFYWIRGRRGEEVGEHGGVNNGGGDLC